MPMETGGPAEQPSEHMAADERARALDALALAIAKTRTEAIQGRRATGIEEEWLEDEEYYEGIDDTNRGEKGVRPATWRQKPAGQLDPADRKMTGSTVFLNITRPYCDAASARLGDMLLPTDDRPWSLKPTPHPDMVTMAGGEIPPHIQQQIAAAAPQGDPEAAQQYQADTQGQIVDKMKELMAAAQAQADKAQARIEDWHVECQFHAQVRRVVEAAIRSGTGILKGPVPERRKVTAFVKGEVVVKDEIKPVSREVDRWNFFPDPTCGESIHHGSYVWERDEITRKSLEDLMGGTYLDDQIAQVLVEGPHTATNEWDVQRDYRFRGLAGSPNHNLFEIWYTYCRLDKADLASAGIEYDGLHCDVMLTLVNNHVVKAALSHLDTGEFPYDVYVYQPRQGLWAGIGLARQIRTSQRIVNGAMRNMMDNAGLAGGPMLVFKHGVVSPANGIVEIAPRKVWIAAEDSDIDDVEKAIRFLVAPMMQEETQAIVMLGLKLAEDITGLPALMQGQQGAAPDTVGGMQILNNNAGAVVRRAARLFDDLVTEPHVRRYYTYLLQYGDDAEKGDFQIDARGSSALVERDLQSQQIMQMGQLVLNPVFGIDPKKWMDESLKGQKLDPKRFVFEDQDWQKVVEQMSQQPQDSSIEVANVRAQSALQVEQARSQSAMQIEQARQQGQERDREMEIALHELEREVEQLTVSAGREDTLDKVKADLAAVAMKLRAQEKLSLLSLHAEALRPPTEPAGRAPAGQAYQR